MANKLGICEWVLPVRGPFSIRLAAELGFQGVQLDDLGGYRDGFPLANKRIQQGYLEEAQNNNIELISLGLNAFAKSGALKTNRNTPGWYVALQCLEISIRCCADLNIPILMLPCFWSSFFTSFEENRDLFDLLDFACKLAQDHNIIIGLESVLTINELEKLKTRLNHRNFKIYYDTQNPYFFKTAVPAEEIRHWGIENIIQIHFKDGSKQIQGCNILGQGETDFLKTVEAIKDINYNGYLVLENFYNNQPMYKFGIDVLELIKNDVQVLKMAFEIL